MSNMLSGLAASALSLVPYASFVKEFIDHAYPDADEGWRLAAAGEYQDMVHDLDKRMRHLEDILRDEGKELYPLGPIRTRRLLLSWAKVMGDAEGEVKRDAVNNATARQFDPRWHSADVRQYWFQQVSGLSDIEIRALQTLADVEHIAYFHVSGTLVLIQGQEREALDGNLATALGSALSALMTSGVVAESQIHLTSDGETADVFTMSGRARALLEAIAEIGQTQQADDAAQEQT